MAHEISDPDEIPRLADLGPRETLRVACRCGRMTEYLPGALQKRHGVSPDARIMAVKSRCAGCGSTGPFKLILLTSGCAGSPEVRP